MDRRQFLQILGVSVAVSETAILAIATTTSQAAETVAASSGTVTTLALSNLSIAANSKEGDLVGTFTSNIPPNTVVTYHLKRTY